MNDGICAIRGTFERHSKNDSMHTLKNVSIMVVQKKPTMQLSMMVSTEVMLVSMVRCMVLVFIFQAMQLIVIVMQKRSGMVTDLCSLYAFWLARQREEIVQ